MQTFLGKPLLAGEEILDTFRPDLKKSFVSKDKFFIPISLLFFVWASSTLIDVSIKNSSFNDENSLAWLFFLLSLYLLFGRFSVKKDRKKRITYAITNKRFLRVTKTVFGKVKVDEVNIKDADKTEIDGTPPDPCNIVFKTAPFSYTSFFANMGLGFDEPFTRFCDIRKGYQISELVIKLRKQSDLDELAKIKAEVEAAKKAKEEADLLKEKKNQRVAELNQAPSVQKVEEPVEINKVEPVKEQIQETTEEVKEEVKEEVVTPMETLEELTEKINKETAEEVKQETDFPPVEEKKQEEVIEEQLEEIQEEVLEELEEENLEGNE